MIVFDVPLHTILVLIAGVILPLLVGLATTRLTNSGHKAMALAALSVVASLATELAAALQAGTAYNLGLALLTALGTFLVAVGTHYGLWKPTGVTDAVLSHGRTADVPAASQPVRGGLYPAGDGNMAQQAVQQAQARDRVVDGPDHRAPDDPQ